MKKVLLIKVIFCCILIFGCKTIPKDFKLVNDKQFNNFSNNLCGNLKNEIQNKWAIHKEFDCYFYNKKLIEKIIKESTCFIGISEDELKSLFGKPNRSENSIIRYNIAKECGQNNDIYGDYNLIFRMRYDENNLKEVSSIKFDKVTRTN